MSRSIVMYIDDMIESARLIIEFSRGLDIDSFCSDRKTRDATIRNLEVLGEASKNMPEAIRLLVPEIPWRRIAGMRDVLAHGYFGVDEVILWDVVKSEVPLLLPHLLSLKKKIEPAGE